MPPKEVDELMRKRKFTLVVKKWDRKIEELYEEE